MSYKKRILILNQWFEPEPTFKGLLFAKTLKDKGFDVEVLTGFPNYPQGVLYPSYKLTLIKKERINGIDITRVILYPSHDNSAIRRSLNYISFFFSSMIYGLFLLRRTDLIYAYHPPITTGLSASIISFFRKIPFVYDIQDLWPDNLPLTGMIHSKTLMRIISKICLFVYRSAKHIVVLSPGFKDKLVQRGLLSSKIKVIYNWCDESKLLKSKDYVPSIFTDNKNFKILFAGNMGTAQGLITLIKAARIIQDKKLNIDFILLGDGLEKDHLVNQAAIYQLNNLYFLPTVPMNDVGCYLKSADCLFVHLIDEPLFEITIPSKIQAYMAIGRPILLGVKGNAADLVLDSNSGVTFKPGDHHALVDSAISLYNMSKNQLDQLGSNGKEYYFNNLSSKQGINQFISLFNQVIHSKDLDD